MTVLYCIRPKGFNIGNDVIYLALNHFIRESFGGVVNIISLPATGKYESQRKAGLNSQTIYEINQTGNGLIIGGGNLYENGELEINHNALKALSVPTMIFSLSRGKIYNNDLKLVDRTDVMTDENIKVINRKASISLSRDSATYEYVKALGEKNILGGCPTLFINEIPQHLVPVSKDNQTDALISVRTPSLMSIPVDYQYNLRNVIVEIIEVLRTNGYLNIKLLCHDHRDIPFADSFKGIDYIYTEDCYAYLTLLRNTKLNITFRLHSFLPALAFDVPAIKISYDQRAISMLDTIGMSEWNINYLFDNVVDEVKKRIKSLSDLENMKARLRNSRWKELREVITSNFNKFADLVSNEKSQKK